MRAYFTEGEAIADRETLVRLVAELGVDADEARDALELDRFAEDVREDEQLAGQLGIQGVPFFVLDRRYGVSGAQPPEALRRRPSNGRGARRLVSAREDASLLAAALAARRRPRRPGRRLEAGHRARRVEHRPGQPRAHRRRRAARRLAEGRRHLPHRDRAGRQARRDVADRDRLGEHERPGADRRARRPAGVLGRHPLDRGDRDQPGPQHGVLVRRRRDVGSCSPGSIVPLGAQAYASDTSATHAARTAPRCRRGSGRSARGCTRGSTRRRRTSTTRRAGSYGNDSGNLAADASGAAMLAWFSDAAAPRRPRAGASAPTARPAGARAEMPGTTVMVGGPELSRTPIVARPKNGGFYVARGVGYPTAEPGPRVARRVELDDAARHDRATRRDRDRGRRQGPPVGASGRTATFGDQHVLAARSNPAATRFGAAGRRRRGQGRALASTRSTPARRRGRARRARRVRHRHDSSASTYVTRVLPGLTLDRQAARGQGHASPSPTRATRSRARRSRPAGKSGKTDAKGRVVLTLEEQGGLAGDRERATSLQSLKAK